MQKCSNTPRCFFNAAICFHFSPALYSALSKNVLNSSRRTLHKFFIHIMVYICIYIYINIYKHRAVVNVWILYTFSSFDSIKVSGTDVSYSGFLHPISKYVACTGFFFFLPGFRVELSWLFRLQFEQEGTGKVSPVGCFPCTAGKIQLCERLDTHMNIKNPRGILWIIPTVHIFPHFITNRKKSGIMSAFARRATINIRSILPRRHALTMISKQGCYTYFTCANCNTGKSSYRVYQSCMNMQNIGSAPVQMTWGPLILGGGCSRYAQGTSLSVRT